jgi:hypothetical protein
MEAIFLFVERARSTNESACQPSATKNRNEWQCYEREPPQKSIHYNITIHKLQKQFITILQITSYRLQFTSYKKQYLHYNITNYKLPITIYKLGTILQVYG